MTTRLEPSDAIATIVTDRPEARNAVDGPAARDHEFALGKATHDSGESQDGARRFAAGAGRHGRFEA